MEKTLLIPFKVGIPDARFEALVEGLARLEDEPASIPLLASALTQYHLGGSDHETSRRRSE